MQLINDSFGELTYKNHLHWGWLCQSKLLSPGKQTQIHQVQLKDEYLMGITPPKKKYYDKFSPVYPVLPRSIRILGLEWLKTFQQDLAGILQGSTIEVWGCRGSGCTGVGNCVGAGLWYVDLWGGDTQNSAGNLKTHSEDSSECFWMAEQLLTKLQ